MPARATGAERLPQIDGIPFKVLWALVPMLSDLVIAAAYAESGFRSFEDGDLSPGKPRELPGLVVMSGLNCSTVATSK